MVYSVINVQKDPHISLFISSAFYFFLPFFFINLCINFCIWLFINLFIDFLFTDISFVHICVFIYIHSVIYPFIYLFINVFIYLFIHSFNMCFCHSSMHSFNHFFFICISYFQPVFYRLGMSRGIYSVFSFTHLHYICSFLAALVV